MFWIRGSCSHTPFAFLALSTVCYYTVYLFICLVGSSIDIPSAQIKAPWNLPVPFSPISSHAYHTLQHSINVRGTNRME